MNPFNWINTTFQRQPKPADETTFPSKPSLAEIGVAGESLIGVYADAEKRADNYKPQDYLKMLDSDGTISSLYNLMTLPILSTTYRFKPHADDKNGEQCEFIENALTAAPRDGGMVIPFGLHMADCLMALLYGYRVFERVYKLRDDGKFGYKKLGPLDTPTTYLVRSDDSLYGGLHQRTTFKDHYSDVFLPPDKTFLFTYRREFNYLYGKSAFKAAAYHYEVKHKLYYLGNLGVQVGAIPPGIISGPQDTEMDVKNKLMKAFSRLGLKTTLYKPEEFTIEAYDTSKGRVDPTPLIDHHNSEIYRSCLAQFLMLGQASRSVGSWSLSENHTDIFMLAQRAVMNFFEEHVNHGLVTDLIDLNFAEPLYPTFEFENVSPDAQEVIHDAFVQLATNGQLSEAFQIGLQNMVADKLEIDLDEAQKEADELAAKKAKEAALLPVMPQGAPTALDADGNPVVPAPQPPQTKGPQPPAPQTRVPQVQAPAVSQKKN